MQILFEFRGPTLQLMVRLLLVLLSFLVFLMYPVSVSGPTFNAGVPAILKLLVVESTDSSLHDGLLRNLLAVILDILNKFK